MTSSSGPEMRGGTANCTVVISDERIGSPVRNRFALLTAMNQASVDKFTPSVREGGTIVYNRTLVPSAPARSDIEAFGIRANELAREINQPQAANMIAMGALIRVLGLVTPDSLTRGLERILPQYRHDTIPLNARAIEIGFAAAGSVDKNQN
jgi:2-oxoglutarate ferredoxin oxidoreductase subunit gamma